MIGKGLFKTIYTPLAWTIFIQVLFFLPGNALPSAEPFAGIPYFDKLIHFLFFTGFTGLWSYYLAQKITFFRTLKISFFIVWLIAVFNGIIVEFIQFYYIPFRTFDKADIIADILGASFTYGLCNLIFLKQQTLK